ncbi:hypothetical protein [Arthrobacter sp. H16F315]|uniref:hypothetical protein n=1 Tax=Arthrobacter sp. H16F315 TaxID=2955314 RepID=UPI0020977C07|nr:hypothetical protein [Arthrobacter sp. H16F315]MDD1475434.1 hypothetical protein [Arthrobacter sp. H16F315]
MLDEVPLALDHVQFGPAQAGRADLDDHVPRPRNDGFVDVIDPRILVVLVHPDGFHDSPCIVAVMNSSVSPVTPRKKSGYHGVRTARPGPGPGSLWPGRCQHPGSTAGDRSRPALPMQ